MFFVKCIISFIRYAASNDGKVRIKAAHLPHEQLKVIALASLEPLPHLNAPSSAARYTASAATGRSLARSRLGASQGRTRGFQAALFHLGVLRLGACSQMLEIHPAQPGLRRGDHR